MRGQSRDPWQEVGPPTLEWSHMGQAGWETRGCWVALLVLQVPHWVYFIEGKMMDVNRLFCEFYYKWI